MWETCAVQWPASQFAPATWRSEHAGQGRFITLHARCGSVRLHAAPCPSKEDASPATSDGKRGAAPPPSPVQLQQQQQQKQPRADFSGSTFVAAEAAQQALLAQNLLMLPQPQPQQQQKQKQQRQEAAKAYNEMLVKIAMQRAATLRLDSRLKIETWPSTPSNTTERF